MHQKNIYVISGFTSHFLDSTWINPIVNISDNCKISNLPYFNGHSGKSIHYVHYNHSFNNKFFVNLSKFFHLIRVVSQKDTMLVGIYEIPHGMLALIVGKIKRIPSCINFISNPGYSKVRTRIRKFITVSLLKNVDYVTVCGTRSKNILTEWGVPKKKIKILPNSADSNIFFKTDLEKKYDLLSLGRLTSVKKLEYLVLIVKKLKELIPEISLAIGGSGSERRKLELLTQSYNLQDNIHFLGHVSMDNLNEFYNSGRIFVLTSETEGLPRTVVEAMTCGIPCVVPDIGDLSDLVINNSSSVLINNNKDISMYVKKIHDLLVNNKYYTDMSEKCIEHIKSNYSQERATQVWSQMISLS